MRINSVIERRVLLNYRLSVQVARELLPGRLRPQIVRGSAVAGTCFIRLGQARPMGFPAALGWRIENAAHRIAVEWDGPSGTERGVYLPQQYTNSKISAVAAGQLLPGPQQYGIFDIQESDSTFQLAMHSGSEFASAKVVKTEHWQSQLFETQQASSDFFEASPIGWASPVNRTNPVDRASAVKRTSSATSDRVRGVRLSTQHWSTSALAVQQLESSFFQKLPPGTAIFDHALLMQKIPAVWSAELSPVDTRLAQIQ